MRFTTAGAITALILLGACGKSGDSVSMHNASIDQVAKTQKAKIQPGEWAVTVDVLSQEITGGPAGMPTPPKRPPMTMSICITPEQVDRPEGMFGGGMDELKKNCTYDNFTMVDGRIDAKMHCTMPNGMKVEATNSGTFTATDMSSDSTSTVSGMPGGMGATTHTKMTAKRTGACTTPPSQPTAANQAG